SDVKIPFIQYREGLDAVGDRMLRQFFELGVPGGIDRPVDLESAADPIKKLLLPFLNRRLGRVVQADQSDTSFHKPANGLETVILQQGMARTSVAVNYYRICTVKRRVWVNRPAVAMHR